jgi:hypothetical protein
MIGTTFGYLDPGTGSLILQSIVGGVAAAVVFGKFWWRRILEFLHLREPNAPEETSAHPEDGDSDDPAFSENGEQPAEQREPAARR